MSSEALKEEDKTSFDAILKGTASEATLSTALKDLSKYLYLHTKVKPWILIDEYDTPIQAAYTQMNHRQHHPDCDHNHHNYYEDMINFMRGLFGEALKTNPYLNKAVITGILRIAKESLFSDVNHLKVYSLLKKQYSEHFGFTESEVSELLVRANLSDKAKVIKKWYNGYQIGETTIYNPWSIVNCIVEGGETIPYWINTSDSPLIKNLLKTSPLAFKQQFERLIRGEAIEEIIDEHLVFRYLDNNTSAIWNLLLMSGYLKPVSVKHATLGMSCQLAVPNYEINNFYCRIIAQWLSNDELQWYQQFIHALIEGNIPLFKKGLEQVMLQIVSYHDLAKEPEAFFHGLVLGLTSLLQESHEVLSNRESGLGRPDVLLIPKNSQQLGIVMEFKNSNQNSQSPSNLAQTALQQIDAKQYVEAFKQKGVSQLMKVGIGFRGKESDVCYVAEQL